MTISAQNAVKALQRWYGANSSGLYTWNGSDDEVIKEANIPSPDIVVPIIKQFGLWDTLRDTQQWWNSANAITALIDYMLLSNDHSYLDVVNKTFTNGPSAWRPKPNLNAGDFTKAAADATAQVTGNIFNVNNVFGGAADPGKVFIGDIAEFNTNFLNDYYDDEGWWALAWIKAYDLTRDQKYLNMAETIFQDMTVGWSDDSPFYGGIFWAKNHKNFDGSKYPYKNAIANELFMAVAARLYLRTKNSSYKNWAVKEANWFINSGLIKTTSDPGSKDHTDPGAPNLIYDSLDFKLDPKGKADNTEAFWTYNCGVILHALCDLSIITGDQSNLLLAAQIASAAMDYFHFSVNSANKSLADHNGILTERNPSPSSQTPQFKGIFIRNLASLFANVLLYPVPNPVIDPTKFSTYITTNANSVLNNGNASSQFGTNWDSRPPDNGGDSVDFIRQSAAIDAINAANRVIIAAGPISLMKTLAQVGLKPSVNLREVIGWLTPSVRAWATAFTT